MKTAGAWAALMRIVRDRTDRSETPGLICHAVVEGFGFARCALAVVDHGSRTLVPIAAHDGTRFVDDRGLLTIYRIPLDPAHDGRYQPAAWCAARDHQIHCRDEADMDLPRDVDASGNLARLLETDDYILTPVHDQGRVVAVLGVDRKGQDRRLGDDDAATLEDICALLSIRAVPSLPVPADEPAANVQRVVDSPDVVGPLLAALDRAVILTGPDGRITWANTAACVMAGAFPWDLAGIALRDHLTIDAADDEVQTAPMQWRKGRLRHTRSEDVAVDVQVMATGRHRMFIVREDAVSADSARSEETLAMLVHDMKAPLQGIIGNTELLLAGRFGGIGGEQRAAIARIGENSEYVLELASRIQCAADLDETLIRPERVDLSVVVDRIIARMEGKAAARGIRLDAIVQPGLGPVCGDEFHIAEAIQNLVDNALNASTGTDSVVVRARSTSGRFARIDVAGCREEDALPMHDAASAASGSPPIRRLFHGLGLTIARRIATAHGGKLWAEGTSRGAMTVSFTVPFWIEPTESRDNGNGNASHSRH